MIELKILHKSLEKTLAEGLEQTWAYLDLSGAEAAHLVIFERTPDRPWADKLFRREQKVRGRAVTGWGI